MKRTKLEIGLKVNGSNGQGTIIKIITKSSGYVLVDYNGTEKKEMAFNLTDENGVSLKKNPNEKRTAEKFAEKMMISSNAPASWINEDGSTDWDKKNDFEDEIKRSMWKTKSF